MAASRVGAGYVKYDQLSYVVPVGIAASEDIGANTLVGITSAGYAEQAVDGTLYNMVLYSAEELEGGTNDGDVQAKRDLRRNIIVKLDLDGGGADDSNLGDTVYVLDHETVSTSDNGATRSEAGEIVEVHSATEVYVKIK